jgi:hypothetical protein
VALPCSQKQAGETPAFQELAPPGALRGKRFAGESNHFHGTDDTTRVSSVNLFERFRVTLLQLMQQIRERRGFEFGAQLFIGRRRVAKSVEKRLEVKPRAATEDRHSIPR